jgi:hypothetical protein
LKNGPFFEEGKQMFLATIFCDVFFLLCVIDDGGDDALPKKDTITVYCIYLEWK